MRHLNERNIIVILLTFLILLFSIVGNTFTRSINIENYQLGLQELFVVIIIIIINLVKSNKSIEMSFTYTKDTYTRFFTLISYYIYIFTILSILTFNRHITFLIAFVIIFSEIILIVMNLSIYKFTKKYSFSNELLRIKDTLFFLMIIVLLLSNIVFSTYSISLDFIFATCYIACNFYIIYNLYSELKKHNTL